MLESLSAYISALILRILFFFLLLWQFFFSAIFIKSIHLSVIVIMIQTYGTKSKKKESKKAKLFHEVIIELMIYEPSDFELRE